MNLNVSKTKKGLLTTVSFLTICFPIRAYAASPSSETTVNAVTLANTPAQLQIDKVETTDVKLTVNYDANENPHKTFYSVDVSLDNHSWEMKQDKSMDNLRAELKELKPNTKYFVRVYSYNQDDPHQTNGKYLTGVFLTKPAKPNPPVVSIVNQDIKLNWQLESGTNAKLLDSENELITIVPSETSKKIERVIPDTKYEFSLVHSNETGDSEPSEKIAVWSDVKPPTNLRKLSSTEQTITVGIDNNGNPDTTTYKYRVVDLDGKKLSESEWINVSKYEFNNLKPGLYKVYVKARNNLLNPKIYETPEIELETGTIPTPVTIETVPLADKIEIKLISNSTGSEVVEYRIMILGDDNAVIQTLDWTEDGKGWAKNGLQHTFEKLSSNTKYIVKGLARFKE
ncbi:fibronectin type III domain-containing protein [Brevibacillus halotolerans]|uniref:fibronectin type III domain-containing protein n=1 Tax=Brevibacillus halotolerans TaxID=1507437 RepID=UPI0015EF5AFC|nr:fibronectin type III domain-containing protein [Brevibacillus halotolerans]MBA4533796.1 fibronectin type III domain-containing protein [Brevibacillus halotolerans]